ncbi:hypothetical protein HY643_03430 [Candidatus Woesearchaeota archaeon]|nr:hypothetical protein [Candidatus Woesearchaeota archaeon]
MIELGEHIVLEGFESLDPATLVVVKKFVGTHAKKFGEENGAFDKLCITLTKGDECHVSATLTNDGGEIKSENTNANLFFALGAVFTKLREQF